MTDGEQAIRGRIVDLRARSLLEIESLTIRGESGEILTILTLEAGGVALGQLAPEHMVSGLAAVATYHNAGGRLALDAISD